MHEPASGLFFREVAPGDSLQAAVDACPSDGALLLLPGKHAGPVTISQRVHVFGRGAARILPTPHGLCIICMAAVATLDGLVVGSPLAPPPSDSADRSAAVRVTAGQARLQDCDITGTFCAGVAILSGDPVFSRCR